ncbi:MAG: hypothetical protein ACE5FC_00550 [Myxococcota bacterium]
MSFRRFRFAAALALVGALLLPASALAHDDYEDPFETHPFKLCAEGLYAGGYFLDRLVLRPVHWLMNSEPGNTLTGHEKMNTRLPAGDLDDMN